MRSLRTSLRLRTSETHEWVGLDVYLRFNRWSGRVLRLHQTGISDRYRYDHRLRQAHNSKKQRRNWEARGWLVRMISGSIKESSSLEAQGLLELIWLKS